MPWDGSNNYQYPPGTEGVPDQTIESIKYNTFIADLRDNDLNKPRPITRGGTGAGDAVTALSNLGGEKAQQVVTNYDSMTWLSGSFYSAAGATSAPVAGHRFVGMVSVQDANNMVIQAFDLDSTPVGEMYTKIKKDGVWSGGGAWGTGFVKKSGDTMSGALTVTPKGSMFGNASGTTATGAVVPADANILFYGGGSNWAGIGTDGSGSMWFRTGLSGTPVPALYINSGDQKINVTGSMNVTGATNLVGNAHIGTSAGNKSTPTRANTNIRLYDAGETNWAGIGVNTSGEMYFVTSNAGVTATKMVVTNAGRVGIGNLVPVHPLHVGAGTSSSILAESICPMMVQGTGQTNLAVKNQGSGVELQNFADTAQGIIGTLSSHPLVIRAFNTGVMTLTNTGLTVTSTIPITAAANGHIFGGATGTGGDVAHANIKFYDIGGGNWCGIGSDSAGGMWFRTGNSGSPAAAIHISPVTRQATFNQNVLGPQFRANAPGSYALDAAGTEVVTSVNLTSVITSYTLGFALVQQGIHQGGVFAAWRWGVGSSIYDFRNDGGAYKPGGGAWADISDARIKDVQEIYAHGLNEIIKLQPVVFRYKNNASIMAPPPALKDGEEPSAHHKFYVKTHDAELLEKNFIGLIAQQAETSMPELVIQQPGYVDGEHVDDLRSLDPSALTYALINAVKTLHQRVSTLEGA